MCVTNGRKGTGGKGKKKKKQNRIKPKGDITVKQNK